MRPLNTLLILILVALPLALVAQPSNPGGDVDNVPITGIEWLIGGGALLGARNLWARFKSSRKS